MLSETTVKELSTKWQTTPFNVAREYAQHVFLSTLYQYPQSDHLGFKGGTALRLLYKSPRFSEDLDFSGALRAYHLEELLKKTTLKVSEELAIVETLDSKSTTGGYLAAYQIPVLGMGIRIELNVSLRGKPPLEPILVTTPLYPSYQCLTLATETLVGEKCQALLTRKKPRDYFDLYYMMRERLGLKTITRIKRELSNNVSRLDSKACASELKVFLPVSYHKIASHLKESLLQELDRI
jgi:predicted nucleotidyltransferase component of viral defense system